MSILRLASRLDAVAQATAFVAAVAGLLMLSGAACGDPGPDIRTAADTAAASGALRILKGEHGPESPNATLTIVSPAADEVVDSDSVTVRIELSGLDLGGPTSGEQSKGIDFSREGQHVHVIVDNEPYKAMYQTDAFSVGPLAPGVHTLRVFPSRSWHESYKMPGVFAAQTFYVMRKQGDPLLRPGQPMLTYSRPKGDYTGENAKRILLDFYLTDVQLAPNGHKVVVSIDGRAADTLTEWAPYFVEGLPDGEHRVRLQLVAADFSPVAGPFNDTERTIRVARGEAELVHH
jgi:hypothetical protein